MAGQATMAIDASNRLINERLITGDIVRSGNAEPIELLKSFWDACISYPPEKNRLHFSSFK